MSERTLTLVAHSGGERLDRFLAESIDDLSRAQVQRLISDGLVEINRAVVTKASHKLSAGDSLVVRVPPPAPAQAQPEDIPLAIVYDDDDVLVINKPAGMVVHPAAGHAHGTLVNAVLAYAPDIEGVGDERRPGIVHRLDKDTSGLIVVAKNNRAHRHLQTQFKDRLAEKHYATLVVGVPPSATGRIEAAIGRDPKNRQRMSVLHDTDLTAREAVTEYRTVEAFKNFTLLDAEPKTGRTHQIRVHMLFLGCPLAGDSLYATRKSLGMVPPHLSRHFLHSARLTITLPSGLPRTFEAPLPPDLTLVLSHLREHGG